MYFVTFLFRNLIRRKARSALTGFGIAVAVGTMVAFLGVAEGFENATLESLVARGVDLVVVEAGVPNQLSSDLDEKIGDQMRAIPGVKAVTGALVEFVDLQRGQSTIAGVVQGWPADSYNFNSLKLESGRMFQSGDERTAMLGRQMAENLKKTVGDPIIVQREEFKVIGVFHSLSHFEDGSVILLLPECQALMARPAKVTGFSVVLDHAGAEDDLVETVRHQVENLKDDKGRLYRLSAQTTSEYVNGSMHIRLARAMAWLTSVIAVFIGAIGMLNTMIMSVLERVREIGILRAIGWRKSRIVRMLLGESLILSLAGAALGIGLAIALTRLLTSFPEASGFISGDISYSVMMRALLMALLVGLVGGSYPAYRAARLLPTEALRHE